MRTHDERVAAREREFGGFWWQGFDGWGTSQGGAHTGVEEQNPWPGLGVEAKGGRGVGFIFCFGFYFREKGAYFWGARGLPGAQ